VAKASAAFDASRCWASSGARSAGSYLAFATRARASECARRVRLGRALRRLPATEAAWEEGEITGAHVGILANLARSGTEEALARDETMLVDQARELRFASFERAMAYWEQLADPDGVEDRAEERRNRRDAYLVSSYQGSWIGRMNIDPISGAIVSGIWSGIEDELHAEDQAEARARLGREPRADELARSFAQRRADALVEMAVRAATAPPGGRRPAPLFSVLVGWETLSGRICALAQGQVLTPGSLVPWLDRAYMERAVFGPDRRVEVSRTVRLFTGATRRAVELRDQRCTHPYCDRPVNRCQVDHIVPYSLGGETTQDNGRLLCGWHNRLRNGSSGREHSPPDGEGG